MFKRNGGKEMKKQNYIFLFVVLIFIVLMSLLKFNYQVDVSKLYLEFLTVGFLSLKSNLIVLFSKIIIFYSLFVITYLIIIGLINKLKSNGSLKR